MPVVGRCPGHLFGGEECEGGCCVRARLRRAPRGMVGTRYNTVRGCRPSRIDGLREFAPQPAGEPAQRKRDHRRARGRVRVDKRDECARRLVIARDGGHDDLHARTGDGEREHPQLVVQHFLASVDRAGGEVFGALDELPGVKQRSAQPQVRPDALLHARRNDHVERRTDDTRRRGDEYGIAERLRRQGVFGNVGVEHLIEENGGRTARLALDEPFRCRE